MLLSNLMKENNTFETTIAFGDGTNKSKTNWQQNQEKVQERQQNSQGASMEPYVKPVFDLFVTFKSTKLFGRN